MTETNSNNLNCKTYKPATAHEAKEMYRLLGSKILQYNRRQNKQNQLYLEQKEKMFKKLQKYSTINKSLNKTDNLKPKIESKICYLTKKIQFYNEYETLHPIDLYSTKSFNEWLIENDNKNQIKNSKEYLFIDNSNNNKTQNPDVVSNASHKN